MFKKIERVFNNRYNVIKELGKGGMSVVYLAVSNDELQQYRAIKCIKYEMIAGESILHEAKILKDLEHDGIPRVIEIQNIHESRELYLVQEYVAGKNLKVVKSACGQINELLILEWFKQLALILVYIHKKGVIHGDVKPENIMLTEEAKLKLIDFGISFSDDNKAKRAYSNFYASPEQRKGNKIDAKSDIYSLAVTLYSIFDSDLLKNNRIDNKSINKSDLRNTFSISGLFDIFAMCIDENPARRYQSSADLLQALNDLDEKQSVVKSPLVSKKIQMWLSVFLIIIGLIFTISGFSRSILDEKISYKNDLQRIQDYIQLGKMNEARIILKAFETKSSESVLVDELNAKILFESADYQRCADYIETMNASKLSEKNKGVTYYNAKSLYYLNRFSDALKPLKDIYLLNTDDEVIACNYIVALVQSSNNDLANKVVDDHNSIIDDFSFKTLLDAEMALQNNDNDKAIENYKQLLNEISNDDLAFDLYLRLNEAYKLNIKNNPNSYLLSINELEVASNRFKTGRQYLIIQEILADAYLLESNHSKKESRKVEMLNKAIALYEPLLANQLVNVRLFNKLAYLYRQMLEIEKLENLIALSRDKYSEFAIFKIYELLLRIDQQSLLPETEQNYDDIIMSYRALTSSTTNLEVYEEFITLKMSIDKLEK